jgi:predicted dehydrogenase
LKILVIGLGSIAQRHIEAIHTIDLNAEIFALRHSKGGKETERIKSIYSWDEVIFHPDFILISNPTSEHAEAMEKAIQFNCPLFIEKPALHNLEKADHLLKLIKENNIITYVGCDLRFHPSLLFIKSYLKKNSPIINEINIYCGSFLPGWRKGVDYRNVYSSIPELGGGVHLDLIHEPDYCYWIFGKPLSVRRSFSNKSSIQIKAYDYANYLFEYPSFNASIILNYYRKDSKRSLEIITSDGTITLDLLTGVVTNSEGKILFQSSVQAKEIYLDQMKHFIGCVRTKKESIHPFEESLEVLKLCMA